MASDASPDLRMFSTSSMIVELLNTVSPQDEDIERFTYQRMLLPAPAYERGKSSVCDGVSAGRRLTFTVYPKEGTWSRCLPFRERVTINEPRSRLFLP